MKYNNYDLVVVGSSFATTFFLKKYLEKAPDTAKILVLERGYFYSQKDRLKDQKGEKSSAENKNEYYKNTIINNTPDKHWIFSTGFGGSSNCWFACTPRFLPNDFRMKTLYGVGADWPISYEDISPYYTQVEEIMSISGPEETPFPKDRPYPPNRLILLLRLIKF